MWWSAVARLAGLVTAIGLVTSRLGLVLHELVGHGGTAVALGGAVSDVRLFWFAGGWIHYDLPDRARAPQLAVALGGIAVEIVIGVALAIALRRRTTAPARLARGVAAALLVHAGWYLATGTWHGYGDGALLYRALGAARYPVAIAAGLITAAVAYAGARGVLGTLAAELPGGRGAKLGGVALAAVVAGALQGGLVIGELRVRGDTTYGAIMRPERERVIARELWAWQQARRHAGHEVTASERAIERRRLAARHTEPPFAPALAVLVIAAIALGAWRARPDAAALTGRQRAIAAALAVGAIALVIAIDAAWAAL